MTMNAREKKSLFKKLLLAFGLSYLMSNGPGLLLVNKPLLIGGIPLLYLWALGWVTVQIGIILYAYFALWRDETLPDSGESGGVPGDSDTGNSNTVPGEAS